VADVVAALLSAARGRAPTMLPGSTPEQVTTEGKPLHRWLSGPTGLGTRSATPWRAPAAERDSGPPELYCPPAVRDNPALGEEVNDRLLDWAEQMGIYPGQLDKVRAANFGRLIMLTHPDTDDPDRLLAAARCALAEWSVDDHYVDGEAEESVPERLGQRLAIAYSVIDQAYLPVRYAPQLEQVVRADPVMRALRSSIGYLTEYACWQQIQRLRHALCVMFTAYNQEAVWRMSGIRPPVWEYLMHRHENSFIPCMVLIDCVAGYELSAEEFAQPAVRRAFSLAGTATVLVNDIYSMAKEDPTDTNLPTVIAAEEHCSLSEAIERSAAIHDELVHTFEAEATALCLTGSPELRRFLAGTWAWLGGNREWHATSSRYQPATNA
jgi:2-methylisoborneol synthase